MENQENFDRGSWYTHALEATDLGRVTFNKIGSRLGTRSKSSSLDSNAPSTTHK